MLVRWSEATREELNDLLPRAIVVVPTGATEQHGPHLPTGHDSVITQWIAEQAASRAQRPVVTTPVLWCGSSAHHVPFGGTLTLRSETYLAVLRDLLGSIVDAGGRTVLVLNGHGGNHELNQVAVRDTTLERPDVIGLVIAAASYWTLAEQALRASGLPAGMRLPGHAGWFETATMLAVDPAAVRERAERATDPSDGLEIAGVRIEREGLWQGFDGYTDFPHRATAEEGERLLEGVVNEVAAAMDAIA